MLFVVRQAMAGELTRQPIRTQDGVLRAVVIRGSDWRGGLVDSWVGGWSATGCGIIFLAGLAFIGLDL